MTWSRSCWDVVSATRTLGGCTQSSWGSTPCFQQILCPPAG